eukprot:6179923-Pleurochrysis_carterae.AAC.3
MSMCPLDASLTIRKGSSCWGGNGPALNGAEGASRFMRARDAGARMRAKDEHTHDCRAGHDGFSGQNLFITCLDERLVLHMYIYIDIY